MKGDAKGKPPQPQHHDYQDPRAQHTAPPPIDDQMLRNYLADSLPPEDLARVEKALRDSADLRAGSRTSAATARTSSSTRWGASGTAPG